VAADDARVLRRQRWRDALLIGGGLATLALVILTQAWAWRFDRLLYDLGMALAPRSAATDIVIVAIDDASVAAIGRWPWRRAVHTTLLERLAAARPRAVMLDLVLSEADPDPQQDVLLAQALRAAAPVVVPVGWYTAAGQGPRLLEPVGPLRDAAAAAQADTEADSDGILRHTFLRAGLGQADLPHAALALLQAGGEALPADPPVERAPARRSGSTKAWVRDARMAIRYQGPAGSLPRVSYVDVLSGAVPAAALRDKYVLVGMAAIGIGDAYATPMGGVRGEMPGIEVIGQTLQSLRRGDAVHVPSEWLTGIASALAVIALVATFARVPHRVSLGLALGLPLLAVVASVLLMRTGWWISPVGFAPAALLAYPLWSWRRLEVVAAALDREIARLDADRPLSADAGVDRRATPRPIGDVERRVPAISQATERLRRARRFLAVSLDGLPEAVLLADADGQVMLANRRAAALFEVGDPRELAGLSLPRLLSELGSGASVDWNARLQAVAQQRAALVVQTQLPGHGDFLVHVAPAPDPDGPRLIVTCADVSSIIAAERQREEALAFVSHDLRSPVASIAMLADLHQRGVQSLTHDKLIAEVKHLAGRALALSEAFIRAAQAESKPLMLEDGDLAAVVAEAVRDVMPQARASDVQLDLQWRGGAVPARFDHELLARAIGNLLTNAIKFSPLRGTVTVELQPRAGGHVVSVQDQGPGMDAQQMSGLFRAYSRVGASPALAGVGLGLQFVQRVADRHGGWVHADSAPGQGARFELFVPSA
jgi:CHASE2 domain-containing sensor protein/signal transduction histidine kinase